MGILDKCYTPNTEHQHNYLLDSCVFDKRLSNSDDDVNLLIEATKQGYEFYVTELQSREIHGVPDRKRTYNVKWEQPENAARIEEIFELLNVKRVSCYGNPCQAWLVVLDGTYRAIESCDSNEPRVQMFYEIYNDNTRHLNDAVIAESAIYNGCTFISTDKRVIRIVNKYFQNRAIHYDDFIREVQVLR